MTAKTLAQRPWFLIPLAVLLLAACTSDSGSEPTTAAPSATPEATPSSTATPLPTATATLAVVLPVAPEGRSGLIDLDALIDLLIDGDAPAIRAATGDATAFIPTCTPGGSNDPMIVLPSDEWIATLAAADRQLYSITRRSEITEALDVVISLDSADLETRWRFTVSRATVSRVDLPCDRPGNWGISQRISDYVVAPPLVENEVAPPGAPPALDDDGWPTEAEGPLVIYSHRVREVRDPEQPWITWPVIAIVTYDAGAGRELGRFEIEERERTVQIIGLTGFTILIDRGRIPPALADANNGVFAYSLAGEELREVTAAFAESDGTPILAPDGQTLAGSYFAGSECEPFIQCTAFVPLDGTEPSIWPNPNAQLEPLVWRDDVQAVLSRQITHSEYAGDIYLMTLDGQATRISSFAAIAPGGRHIAATTDGHFPWEPNTLGCEAYDSATIYDTGTAEVVATVARDGISIRGTANLHWSPDGRALLLIGHDTPVGTTGSCLAAAWEWQQSPERAFRYNLDTGRTTEVPDPNALREQWSGDAPIISVTCLDTETVALPRPDAPWSLASCADADGLLRYSTLLIDGIEVATLTTPQDADIISIVTPPELAE